MVSFCLASFYIGFFSGTTSAQSFKFHSVMVSVELHTFIKNENGGLHLDLILRSHGMSKEKSKVYLQVSAWCYTVGFKLCIVVTHTVGRIHRCFSWLWPVFRGNKFKHFWNGQSLCWLFLQGYGSDILWTLHLNTVLQTVCQFWWLWLHFKVTVALWVETESYFTWKALTLSDSNFV